MLTSYYVHHPKTVFAPPTCLAEGVRMAMATAEFVGEMAAGQQTAVEPESIENLFLFAMMTCN